MEGELEPVCDLSNGAISNDLEWTLTLFLRSHHSLTLNISQTATDTAIDTLQGEKETAPKLSNGTTSFKNFHKVSQNLCYSEPIVHDWLSALEYCVPVYSYSKLRVAYNDAFRQLLHEPRWCSASRLFVFHNVSSFSAIIRKSYSLKLCSLRDCNNLLVCAIAP